MKKIKVMSVFGTRPEAAKMCPLVRVMSEDSAFESVVCLTGQHREMLHQVTDFFGVKADYDLDIMKPNQTITSITSDVLRELGSVLEEASPDLVLVHGDTTTSFAAALAAFYHKIPVGHVEAGLRTHDRYSPYPEEMNRCLTARLATYHYAPTVNNRENLNREGIRENIYVTGNTVLDAFKYTVRDNYRFMNPQLAELDFTHGRYMLLTAHRRENLGEGIENICRATLRIVESHPDLYVIYPVHLNPAVRNTVFPLLSGHPRILLVDPLELTDMHNLMGRASLCMTDSGGLQEEVPAFGVPVLVLRSETERPEAVDAGTVRVVGTDVENIVREADKLLCDRNAYEAMAHAVNPYGDGHASERIVGHIKRCFNL